MLFARISLLISSHFDKPQLFRSLLCNFHAVAKIWRLRYLYEFKRHCRVVLNKHDLSINIDNSIRLAQRVLSIGSVHWLVKHEFLGYLSFHLGQRKWKSIKKEELGERKS